MERCRLPFPLRFRPLYLGAFAPRFLLCSFLRSFFQPPPIAFSQIFIIFAPMIRKYIISIAFLSLLAVVGCRSAQHVAESASTRAVDSFAVHFIDSFVQRTILDSVFLTIVDTARTVQYVRVSRALSQAQTTHRDTVTVAQRDSTYIFTQSAQGARKRSPLRTFLVFLLVFIIGYALRDIQSRVWK